MKYRRFLGLIPLLFLATSDGKQPHGPISRLAVDSIPGATEITRLWYEIDRLRPAAVEASGAAIRRFAVEFWNVLAETDKNLSVSPYSLAVVLNTVGMGADGGLLAQYEQVLGGDMDSVAAQLTTIESAVEEALAGGAEAAQHRGQKQLMPAWRAVNALFLDRQCDFSEQFLRRAYEGLGASGYQVDFMGDPAGARTAINAFVAEQTSDLIPDLLPDKAVSVDTRLIALNTLWLKLAWNSEAYEMPDGLEFNTTHSTVKVPAISLSDRGRYAEGPGWRSATVPMIGGHIGVTFVLPDEWPHELSADIVSAACRAPATKIRVKTPKFRVSGSLSLKQDLPRMGLTDAFTACYSKFAQRHLELSDVIQKCVVSLDETGIEAAAATAAIVMLGQIPRPERPQELTLDSPFWFIVHDLKTNAPLFVGSVADPSFQGSL